MSNRQNFIRILSLGLAAALSTSVHGAARVHILTREGSSSFLDGTPIGYGSLKVQIRGAGVHECQVVHPTGERTTFRIDSPEGETRELIVDAMDPQADPQPEELPAPPDGVQLEDQPSPREIAREAPAEAPSKPRQPRPRNWSRPAETDAEEDRGQAGYEYRETPRPRLRQVVSHRSYRQSYQRSHGFPGYEPQRAYYGAQPYASGYYYGSQPYYGAQPYASGYYARPGPYPNYYQGSYQPAPPRPRRSHGMRNFGLGVAAIGALTGNRKVAGAGLLMGLLGGW